MFIAQSRYAVLENVAGIAHSRSNANGEEVNTYTVMLCAIVGLGYQIESFLADAWSHGNCQSRTRLILAITKEDYEPLSRPPRSHPHGAGARQGALYEAPNGKRFGSREVEGLTPFRFCSVASCWGYLPHVGDGHVDMCIRYPDHISAAPPDSTTGTMMAYLIHAVTNHPLLRPATNFLAWPFGIGAWSSPRTISARRPSLSTRVMYSVLRRQVRKEIVKVCLRCIKISELSVHPGRVEPGVRYHCETCNAMST
jgi:hypothetical protein